tara:strand:- start:56 stop:490 length:435 start_codon:yes stop_codon:yes gene_type:complete
MTTPVHKHFILRAEVKHPPGEKSKQRIWNWMFFLIKDIGMKIMFGPEVRYVRTEGNEGLTAVAIIETSHVALHVWDKQDPPLLQLDVYTCGPFKPEVVLKAIKEFIPTKIQWKYLDRESDLKTVDIGQWHEDSPWPDNSSLRDG